MEEQRALLPFLIEAGGGRSLRAPQVVVDDFGVQLVLVRDAFVRFGVQIQDGDGIRKTRLLQIQLVSVNTKQMEG